jgi:hypothetical protein
MMSVSLLRYPEPRKVSTNPRWCPCAKGSPREGQAPRSSNFVESHVPSSRASGAPLLAPLGHSLPVSRLEGVNRRNLKIINLSTHYKPGLALEMNPSPKERGNKSTKK